MKKINLNQKLSLFHSQWDPKIIAELNGQHVKLAKIQGEFVWHSHADEDEMFMVLKGQLEIHFRDRVEVLDEGEIIVIPKGVEHKPVTHHEVHILLFEPASTVNTGQTKSTLTRDQLDWI